MFHTLTINNPFTDYFRIRNKLFQFQPTLHKFKITNFLFNLSYWSTKSINHQFWYILVCIKIVKLEILSPHTRISNL